MKQGTGHNSDGGRKVEPRSTAINPKGVSQIGESLGNKAMENPKRLNPIEPVRAGPGYRASLAGRNVMRNGSQGRHED